MFYLPGARGPRQCLGLSPADVERDRIGGRHIVNKEAAPAPRSGTLRRVSHDADDHPGCARDYVPPAVRPLGGTAEEIAREEDRRRRGLLERVVDCHTHLFPDGFYRALRAWFDQNAWSIRFRGNAEEAIDALAAAGVSRLVALVYAHKPGAAAALNAFLAEVCQSDSRVIGVGTVLPGEPDARRIVRDAVGVHGLRGIKLHCHVQRMAVDDPRVLDVLEECDALGVPAVVHTGRAPRAGGYGIDPHEICGVERTERVLQRLPRLKLVIPHLGLDEIDDHLALLDRHENLYLDTTMACADYFEPAPRWDALERRADRIMYGTDFPITPYEADRELRVLARRIVSETAFEQLVRGTAKRFWQL